MTRESRIEELFKTHYARLRHTAFALLHNDDLARDIVHDVFESLLRSATVIAPTEYYLQKAVRNKALNLIRDMNVHRRIADMIFPLSAIEEDEEWPDEAEIEKIRSIIESQLSPQGKRIIHLRFTEGKRFAEVAKDMQLSQTAVFGHLRRALETIRIKLKQDGKG